MGRPFYTELHMFSYKVSNQPFFMLWQEIFSFLIKSAGHAAASGT